MKQSLIALIALRKLVSEMEKDLGMNELSEVERLILLAANELQDTNGEVDSVALREHPLTADLTRPTFFRVVRKLEDRGRLQRPEGVQRGAYSLG